MRNGTWLEVALNGPWGGRQRDDAALYARIIEGIRSKADCIVYPTIPFGAGPMSAGERFAAVESLGQRGPIEWAVVDPGSVNFDSFVYVNNHEHIRHGLSLAARYRFHPVTRSTSRDSCGSARRSPTTAAGSARRAARSRMRAERSRQPPRRVAR